MEYDLGDGWVLRGRADAVTEDTVYEFKFSSPFSQTKPLYFLQANVYSYILGKKQYFLVIIDKKNFEIDVTLGKTDEASFNSVIEKVRDVIECLNKGTPPPGPMFEWECKRCVYEIVCKKYKEWINNQPLKL